MYAHATVTADFFQGNTLVEILDRDTGLKLNLQLFFSREEVFIIQDRTRITERYQLDHEKPWLVCAFCQRGVILCRLSNTKKFYFRHMPSEEDNGCPINTRGALSKARIEAAKYSPEGEQHKSLKELVQMSLLADPNFSNVMTETVIRDKKNKNYRRPDVQAQKGDFRYIFEAQLSTTFLTTIVERKIFYRENGDRLIWIFPDFDVEDSRMSEKDIFVNNSCNAFVVDEESTERSLKENGFFLWCCYPVAMIVGGRRVDRWEKKLISFHALIPDGDGLGMYYVDYFSNRLRMDFLHFWYKNSTKMSWDVREEWPSLARRVEELGFDVPDCHDSPMFHAAVSLVLSAKEGKPVGYKFKTLLEVANLAFNHRKRLLRIFGWTLRVFKHHEILQTQDRKGTWGRYVQEIRYQMSRPANDRDEAYDQDEKFDRFILFLVPELESILKARSEERSAVSEESLEPKVGVTVQCPG